MKTFAIDTEGKITAFQSDKEAERQGASKNRFHSIEDLTNLTSMVPLTHLVSIWNEIPGVKPVRKFTDRKTAVRRIWKALHEPEQANKRDEAKERTKSPREKLRRPAHGRDQAVRPGTKKADVIAMLRRAKGATLAEIVKATDWQAHSVRGFISGILVKRMGLKVTSNKRADGQGAYRLKR